MCVFAKYIPHPVRKKLENSGEFSGSLDVLPRMMLVPCGRCIECLKRKASDWRFRLYQEMALGNHRSAFFVTLTLAPEYYEALGKNVPPRRYLRLFLDRYRKVFGHSCKHWFTHEYGTDPDHTHRLHFHGIIFDVPGYDTTRLPTGSDPLSLAVRQAYSRKFDREFLRPLWKYGITFVGDHCTLDTAIYISKYISKGIYEHLQHPEIWIHPPRIYCSAGIGKAFLVVAARSGRLLRRGRLRFAIGSVSYTLSRYYTAKIITGSDSIIRSIYMDPITLENPPGGEYRVFGIIYDTLKEYREAVFAARDYLRRHKLIRPKTPRPIGIASNISNFAVEATPPDLLPHYMLSASEVFEREQLRFEKDLMAYWSDDTNTFADPFSLPINSYGNA